MTKYLLDTDICIFVLKQKFNLLEKLQEVGLENCYVSEISLAELHFGAYNSTDYEKHRRDVELVQRFAEVIPIREYLALYGKERARLRKVGSSVADFDLLIATSAVHHGLVLVTNNTKHHQRVEGIRLENWAESV